MINSVRMKNFKKIKDTTINFDSKISGVYGPNGSGKTSVVQCIDVLISFFSPFIGTKVAPEIRNWTDFIREGEETSEISIDIKMGAQTYRMGFIFEKEYNDITISKEYILFKENDRQKFKNIFTVENSLDDFLPRITFMGKKENIFPIITNELFKRNRTNFLSLIPKLKEKRSFISIIADEFIKLFKNNKEGLKAAKENKVIDTLEELIKKIDYHLNSIKIQDLTSQAISNLQIGIPIIVKNKEYEEKFIRIKENICTKDELESIVNEIDEINKLFELFVYDSKLLYEKELVSKDGNTEKYALNVFIQRGNSIVKLINESTGTIKLISLLSILTKLLKDKNFIAVLDEIDVHIFEYLLSYILEKVKKHIKGQLIFTSHNLLPMEKLDKKSIILSTVDLDEDGEEKVIYTQFKGKISKSTNFRTKYLKSQYTWTEENISPLFLNESDIEWVLDELGNVTIKEGSE